MQKHVLVVAHAWYGDLIGGAFRLASEFAESLAASGHRVSFLCCAASPDAVAPPVESINGVRIFRYWPEKIQRNGLLRLRHHVRSTKQITKRIHQENPVDALSGHSPLQMLGAMRALPKSVFRSYVVHSPFDEELASNSSGSFVNRLSVKVAKWIDGRIVKECHQLQTDSAFTLATMIEKHGAAARTKGVVAPGWVDTGQFQPVGDRATIRHQLGVEWRSARPVFFTLRRLQNRMGLDTLIAACELLAKEGFPFRTLIGGGGPLKELLQQQIDEAGLAERVFLLGRIPEEQVGVAYAAADCFVLPTKALECFGLIVLEAFACNTPVIASNVAAIPELAARQGTEWMFEPGSVEQLADRMRRFITGQLKPTIELRATAMDYDKLRILKRWEELLMESQVVSSQDRCCGFKSPAFFYR